jgi:GNAT superfamily N-acetyltransferase
MLELSSLSTRVEKLATCQHQMDNLLCGYWNETEAHKGVPDLEMDWDVYQEREDVGGLIIITVRKDTSLVGFNMYNVFKHPHHKGVLTAACDILAVALHHRRQGIGRLLINAAEPLLRGVGVQLMTHNFRTCYEDDPLFVSLGFEMIEATYMKRL